VPPAHIPARRSGTLPDASRPSRPSRLGTRRAALVAPAVLVLAVLAGCSSGPSGSPGTTSAPPATTAVAVHADAPSPDAPSPGATAVEKAAPPVSLSIASVGISTSLMSLGLNPDGSVEVPPADKGMTAGWYSGGPVPGAVGPAVVIGHNDTRYGRAVFHDLRKIAKGADITVTDSRGKAMHFTVTATESVSKKSFPTAQVYGPTSARALRLITCDGDFDANGHPVNNLIVFATLA
jgi:hypothetical protein